jgi:hypothetical protein
MRLNEEQVSIMQEVRDRMYRDHMGEAPIPGTTSVSTFICPNIMRVVYDRAGVELADDLPEGSPKDSLAQLSEAITAGISGDATFGHFMKASRPGYDFGETTRSAYLFRLCRLAWLDKIVQDRQIIAEKLPVKVKLTAPQLELMGKVRDRMTADFEAGIQSCRFICHNIYLIEKGVDVMPEVKFDDLASEEGTLTKELCELIRRAIANCISLEIYISHHVNMNWVLVCRYAQLARLAWLDKIVETGEIECLL